jgi:hypothetical protein
MKANEILNQLPAELKQQVLDTLTAFDSVIIDFENGNYKMGSLSLRDKYPVDFRQVGIIKNSDVYTAEEMKINYANL